MDEREVLIECLRRAVGKLYHCRYSEQPLARELEAKLLEITGQTQHEWGMSGGYARNGRD